MMQISMFKSLDRLGVESEPSVLVRRIRVSLHPDRCLHPHRSSLSRRKEGQVHEGCRCFAMGVGGWGEAGLEGGLL